MMSIRDYQVLARCIELVGNNHRGREGEVALGELVEDLCKRLHLENPKFNVEQFVAKCNVSMPPKEA